MYTTEVRPVTHKIARRFTHHFEKEATVFLTAARRYVFITYTRTKITQGTLSR